MLRVSLIFATVLIIELLTGCGHHLDDQQGPNFDRRVQMGPTTSRAVVVRTNAQNPQSAEYTNLDSAPSKENFSQFANSPQNWQPVDNSRVISGSRGFPQAQKGAYFVQQPKDFVAPAQNEYVQLTAGYSRGGAYGYCNYPNYGGYGDYSYYHYYYPNYAANYSSYYYLPTYYSNYSYWYYQPTYYYPTYYGYNYYIYSAWW